MAVDMAVGVKSLTDTTRGVLLLFLTFAAVALAVTGMWRAFFSRTRTQLVIDDIARADDVPASLTVGLSSELRRAVRRQLGENKGAGAKRLIEALRRDVRDGLAVIASIQDSGPLQVNGRAVGPDIAGWPERGDPDPVQLVRQLVRFMRRRHENTEGPAMDLLLQIMKGIEEAPGREVLNKQRDELGALTGGLGALAPGPASGFTAALAAVLPQQRGLHVSVTAATRETDQQVQIGLTVDVGGLERAADASATFWTRGRPVDGSGQKQPPIERTEFEDLIEPAANWITIHVIGRLALGGVREYRWFGRSWRALLLRTHLPGSRRVRIRLQRRGLRDLLTAQWASWAMDIRPDQPHIALGFSAQARDDASRAAAALDRYYLPSYYLGTIHEHTACCYRSLSRAARREDVKHSYRDKAKAEYAGAVSAFAEAERRLNELKSNPAAVRHLNGVVIDRLKADVLANGVAALARLSSEVVKPYDARTQYNAACLYSAAAAAARAEQLPDGELRSRALGYLTEALRDPTDGEEATSRARKEPDLLDGLTEDRVTKVAKAVDDLRSKAITLREFQLRTSALQGPALAAGDQEAPSVHSRRTPAGATATTPARQRAIGDGSTPPETPAASIEVVIDLRR